MRRIFNSTQFPIYLILVSVFFFNCSDDQAANSDAEVPEVPVINSVQPDLNFFESNTTFKSKIQNFDNFNRARLSALQLSGLLNLTESYASILTLVEGREPDLIDGVWTWVFQDGGFNVNIEYTVTARRDEGRTFWAVEWDYSDGEVSFEDYLLLEGSISVDENSAEWTVNSLNPEDNIEEPVYLTEWERESDDRVDINTEFREDGNTVATIDYMQNGTEHTMTFETESSGLLTIFWDTSTSIGYVEINGERRCWDSSLADTAC